MPETTSGQWWAAYAVRYAQGTIVGALLIYAVFQFNPAFSALLFLPTDPASFGFPHLLLLGVYGFAFTYIASSPIVVMHLARQFLVSFRSFTWVMALASASGVLVTAAASRFAYGPSAAVGLFAMFVLPQWGLAVCILVKQKNVIIFYRELAKQRGKQRMGEYLDSYRHMREHGSAYLIVVFQLVLTLPIAAVVSSPMLSMDKAFTLGGGLAIWVAPATIAWFLANKLEAALIQPKR